MFSPSAKLYLSVSLSCPLQFDIQWRKISFPRPDTEIDKGDDCDPMESVNIGDILDPSAFKKVLNFHTWLKRLIKMMKKKYVTKYSNKTKLDRTFTTKNNCLLILIHGISWSM